MALKTNTPKSLLSELERLAGFGAANGFNVTLDIDALPGEEREIARLLDRILSNCRAAAEYEMMKYQLTAGALGIAYWDMTVQDGDHIRPDKKFVWSREFRRMLGFSDENDFPNIFSSWSNRLHPDDKDRVLSAFSAHIADRTGKTPYDLEFRLMLKNGEYRHFRALGATMRDKSGAPLRVAGALEDITGVVRAQKILGKILDGMDSYIYVTDLETDEVLFLNRKMKVDFGVDKSARGGKCWRIFHPGRVDRCEGCKKDELLKNPDKSISWEKHNPVSGRTIYNIDRIIEWPGGRKVHIQQCVDITEIKRTQKELLHREEMLDTLNKAAIVLLSRGEDAFEDAMTEGVRLISGATDFDRMSVFRNSGLRDDLRISQIYRWRKESGGTTQTLGELANAPYAALIPRWSGILAANQCVNGLARLMPEAETLKRFGCVTIFAAPVFINNRFWGGVLFERLSRERIFSGHEADALRVASLMLANVVVRNEEIAKIREADEHVKLMLDATPLGCVLWNSSHRVIDCNQAAVKIFGFADKADLIERFSDASPAYQPDGRKSEEKTVEMVEMALSKGAHSVEWMHQTQDKTRMPAEVTLARVRYGNDHVVAAYTRDLREHKRMIREIESQNNLLYAVNHMSSVLLQSDADAFERDLLGSMGVIARATNVDRVYIWKNYIRDGKLCCTQLYEWSESAEPQQGKSFTVEVCYADVLPEWQQILPRGLCVNGVVRELSPNERALLVPQKVISILVVPIFLKGWFWGFLGLDDCRTERIFSGNEENILRSASELIAEVLVRNDMEENLRATAAQLQGALTEVQAANRVKSEFLSRMSHEMRTPMNAIIGMTTIGRNAGDEERKNYALDKIGEASTHLLGIVNDILDISKIEENRLDLTLSDFTFKDMLRKAFLSVRQDMAEKQQMFSIHVDPAVPSLLIGDEQRLRQVIVNLLSNAVKFTPEKGEISLDVFLTEKTDQACELRVEVTDNGIGIPPAQREKIFVAFEQAEGGANRKFGGTGLGLSISRRIVEQMDGELWAESEEGAGSRFIFNVKLGRADQAGPPAPMRPGDGNISDQAGEYGFSGKRLLVVEDVELNREILMALLDGTGLNIDVAENGREALEMVARTPNLYDLVFMDIQMPEMDGLEATRRIRSLPESRTGKLPIIAMTANVYPEDIENCLAAGMDDHIGKPLDTNILFKKLRRYL